MIDTEPKRKTCPSCGSDKTKLDPRKGEVICMRCYTFWNYWNE